MAVEPDRDPDLEWLDHVRPVGLVVAPVLLKELGLAPPRQTQADTATVAEHVGSDASRPGFADPWAFFADVLGWEPQHVAGSPGGPPLPEELFVRLPQQDTTLNPTWAVRELGNKGGWQLLVRLEVPGVDPDARHALEGWEASAHQRFERLLRETEIFVGILVSEKKEARDGEDRYTPELRLIYAPRGETSGHLTFPLRALATVAGRPMLGGFKLLLDSVRLFTDADGRRLPALLARSREAQASVSTALAEQVLGALHELLRGLDAADPKLVRELARTRPAHLYEGLLTVLLRLVFVLYAEDRDLLPSRTDGRAREIYETSYSVRGLYADLVEDAALNPDTIDERRGGWGRLLALFRLIHKGHGTHLVQARGGKLFDPDAFAFLLGRLDPADPPRVMPVSDGCILRILEGLMTLKAAAGRERLSYRALDVEQIGSVYEIVMGFTVETAAKRVLAIRAGKHNRTPVFVDLGKLVALNGKERIKYLKEEADRGQLSANVAKAVEAAGTIAEMAAALDPIVDERASPRKHEAAAGTPILQPTDERRRTGSHYTPRSLTEPIVRHALEPAFERLGPDARPEQILDLKVCDPAMGSGAFLVEACRALAARLVAAWARWPETRPSIPPDEDEDLHARRLVAQRCLYGVDKNPLATDLAKLSLWLATLARDHEFTFLDHALKSGDSLVGLSQKQIAAAHRDETEPGLPLFRQLVKQRIDEATKGRAEIQAAPDDTSRAVLERKHQFVEERTAFARTVGDAVIAAFFSADKPRAREAKRAEVESWLLGSMGEDWSKLEGLAEFLGRGPHPLKPFHWEIEYPEVFEAGHGGFDAFIGNPPYSGGTHLENVIGRSSRNWIVTYIARGARGIRGAVDLSAYFFLRCFELLNPIGAIGFVATNSISQGDSRIVGLQTLCINSGIIYRAVRSRPWPGEAATHVSLVWISRSNTPHQKYFIDGKEAPRIDSTLGSQGFDYFEPAALSSNSGMAFKGATVLGSGFIITNEEADLLLKDPKYNEVVFKYLTGDDVNTAIHQNASRWVINFKDLPLERAENNPTYRRAASDYPAALTIVEGRVKPDRLRLPSTSSWNRALKERWWQFGLWRPALERAIRDKGRCLVISRVTAHHCFAVLDTRGMVFSDRLVVIASEEWSLFSILSSRVHHTWAHRPGSTTQGTTLNYLSARSFLSYPRPRIGSDIDTQLCIAAKKYLEYRSLVMVDRREGMTKTYNRFHDRDERSGDIARLRELHADIDRIVLRAYGWDDLADRAEPVCLDETNEDDHTYQGRLFWPSDFRDEVLARLLALNAERHAEEVRLGIAPGMKGNVPGETELEEQEA